MSLVAQAAGGTAEAVMFWSLSVVAVAAAIGMITARNIVHSALLLVVTLFMVAGLFLTLQSSFLAVVQVIVYAGAIMVLFLFVIMLLGVDRDDHLIEHSPWRRLGAAAVGLALIAAVGAALVGPYTGPDSVCGPTTGGSVPGAVACAGLEGPLEESDGSVGFAAQRLFTRHTFAFEFVSLLLIVAIVGTMMMGRRTEPPERSGALDRDPDAPGPDLDAPATAAPHGHRAEAG